MAEIKAESVKQEVKHLDQFPLKPPAASGEKRSVLIIYTGGTIGMLAGADGIHRPVPGFVAFSHYFGFFGLIRCCTRTDT